MWCDRGPGLGPIRLARTVHDPQHRQQRSDRAQPYGSACPIAARSRMVAAPPEMVHPDWTEFTRSTGLENLLAIGVRPMQIVVLK